MRILGTALAGIFVAVALAVGLRDNDSAAAPEQAAFSPNELAVPDDAFPEPSGRPLELPRDHGPHAAQRGEYWLFAGRLRDTAGRRYGFQLAFLRIALQREPPERISAWAARDVYRAHLVVSEAGGVQRGVERYSRAALGLAGAAGSDPARVWLHHWRAALGGDERAVRVSAGDGDSGVELRLALPAGEPVAFDGPGYRGYWQPGLTIRGRLSRDGRARAVTGEGLIDRAWGNALPTGRGQMALTRLWLEPDGGGALRCRQLRRKAGGGTPLGQCLRRAPDGSVERFRRERVSLEPSAGRRELGGRHYPLVWRLALGGDGPAVGVQPLAAPRALFDAPLWSGIVEPRGRSGGWGLLELSNHGRQ